MATNYGMICLLDMSYWHVYSNVNNYFIHHHLFLFFHDSREAESILEASSEESQYRCIHNIREHQNVSNQSTKRHQIRNNNPAGLTRDSGIIPRRYTIYRTPTHIPFLHLNKTTSQIYVETPYNTQVPIRHCGSPYLRSIRHSRGPELVS